MSNSNTPQCFFPVANVPNLHYIIEFLIINKVKEIIIASRYHRDKIAGLDKSYNKIKIRAIGIKPDAASFGDAMREVAENHLIKDDFIVVRGDIITNIDFQDALKMHYNIKKQEKDGFSLDSRKHHTIMTKLFLKRS